MPKILFNFLISPQNKRRFEAVCASNGLSMSSVLNGLIESYVIEQAENVENRAAKIQRLDDAIQATRKDHEHRQRQIWPDDDDDGPIDFLHDDGGEWNEHDF